MSTTATNPIDATPAAPAISNKPTSSSPSKGDKGKPNDKQPIVHNITADSDTTLFPPRPPKFDKLEGEHDATIIGVRLTELPPSEPKSKKTTTRKTKGGKGKALAKSKPSKLGAKLLSLRFQLDKKRADGMTYTVEKEIRAQQDRDSKFGECMMRILTDEGTLNQFFSTYRLSMLLNRRCKLEIKEVRCKGQSSIKILDVLPAPVLAPGFQHSGKTGSSVTGPIAEHALALDKAA